MATPRPARYRARHARPTTLPRAVGVAGLATATTVAFLPAGSATADPTASVNEVERRVAALDTRAGLAVEDFRQAEQQLAEVERRAAVAAEQVALEQARLDEVRSAMSQVVAAAYRRGSSDRLVSLVTDSDPQTFLDRASSLDRIARGQADVLADIEIARHRLQSQQTAAERQLEAKREAERALAERREAIERALAEQRRLLGGLEADQRRQVEAARAAGPGSDRASRAGEATPTYTGPASGRARVAVEEAHRQLGKPYRYGGNGPDSFDCSGLTGWVWRAAGVSLPRTSRDQYAQGRKVSRADLQPGDLVYFGNPIHHVGIYIGDGQMISAPQSGDRVKMQSAFRSDYVGATRP